VYLRACAFLTALFDETAFVLQGDPNAVAKPEHLPAIDLDVDIPSLAAQFREYMNAGITMTRHGRFRAEFYAKVVDRAQKVVSNFDHVLHGCLAYCFQALPLCEEFLNRRTVSNTDVPSLSVSPSQSDAKEFPPITSFKKLERVIRNSPPDSPTPSTDYKDKLRSSSKGVGNDEPLVVLEVDEAHTMTTRRAKPPHEWSNFREFRLALRSLNNCSLFTLFLSTTGKITEFTSSKDRDLSGRVVAGLLLLIAPYTDLGFDQLARKIAYDGNFTIDDITSDYHISHLGRPMYVIRIAIIYCIHNHIFQAWCSIRLCLFRN
jgi:hypothetical protein